MKQARRADDDGDKDRMKRLYVEARDHFQSDISRDECQKSLASLKRDLGMVFVGLHKATGEGRYACEAAQNIRQANELRPETGAVEPADVSLESLDDDCKRSLAPDHTRQWILTGASVGALAAGALMLVLALDAQEEREAADARFYASLPGSAEERRALADFDDASGRTDVLGIAGYAATLAGVALAGWAIYAWVNEAPGEARVVIGVRPGGLVVEARF